MAFERPISIKEAIDHVKGAKRDEHGRLERVDKYVLPAIQREFVWSTGQIETLFDSLLQGYPIGTFLFWKVQSNTVDEYKWYDFVTRYHQKDRKHNPEYSPSDSDALIAILDGQQRLTALNIGLTGSYSDKRPHLRWNNPNAYPERLLYLNIASEAEDDGSGLKYEFRFLTERQLDSDGGKMRWFKVSDIFEMATMRSVNDYILQNGLRQSASLVRQQHMEDAMFSLYEAVHLNKHISYFIESEQNLDKVLNIFVRTNDGGTPLSNSDLLLSIATAQWDQLDARQEVNDRTDDLNDIGDGFDFPRDFVLKSGLVLADIQDIGFRVANFNRHNMRTLEAAWEPMMDATRLAVELADQFGLSGRRLSSQNALLPIAYHVYKTEKDRSFLTSVKWKDERHRIKEWLFRTLVKRVWGGASDTLLSRLRSVMNQYEGDRFPVGQLSVSLAGYGKGLTFTPEELDDLVDTEYSREAFVLLAMMYPDGVTTGGRSHVDHVFPQSRFSFRAMEGAGLSRDGCVAARERRNRLANLQLLPASENESKQGMLPHRWLDQHFASDDQRRNHASHHDFGDLGLLPEDVVGFTDWYEARRMLMLRRLKTVLGVAHPLDESGID